jgi:hypothetical protein
MSKKEHCYINYEREFINSSEETYKLGRTSQEGDKRLKQYPKGTEQIIKIHVSNSINCENEIIKEFKKKFKHRVDIGREYFEGNISDMIKIFINITDKYPIIKELYDYENHIKKMKSKKVESDDSENDVKKRNLKKLNQMIQKTILKKRNLKKLNQMIQKTILKKRNLKKLNQMILKTT